MSTNARFIHIVLFWMQEGADPNLLVAGCHQYLTDIPGVLRMEVGAPAGTDRSVVDNSYGVMLLVEYADTAAHDSYQTHPSHLKFISECSPLWSRVQVYDAITPVR